MSGQVTITQLPNASALTGQELVPVVQSGVTVQTTTGAISGAGALNYPFLTLGSTSGLTQARYLSASSGLSLTDNGAGNTYVINLTGAVSNLTSAGNGIVVKNSASTLINRAITVGAGMTISNGDGIAGNPAIALNQILQNLASTSTSGVLSISGTTISAGTVPVANGGNGFATTTSAPTIASASTIAPAQLISFVSGTTAISTITAPSAISSSGGQITLIPTGVWSTNTSGNIALGSTAVVGKALIMTYDSGTSKWYPSY